MITIEIKRANKVGNDLSLFISFPFNQDVVNVMRELPCRYWHNDLKAWETPFKQLGYVLNRLDKFEIEIKADDAALFQSKKENPVDYKFKTQPFQHQIDGFNYGLTHDRWLLGDEQGLGKTKQVIDIAIAKKQQRDYKHCLIICGVNGLKWNWVNEILTHSDESAFILGQKARRNGSIVIGSTKDKLADLESIKEDPNNIQSYFIITNIESLREPAIADALAELCRRGDIGLVAADEVHKCFDYDTPITTKQGEFKIGDIVTNKLNVEVASYNEITKELEYKPVIGWYENPVITPLMELEIQLGSGEIKVIKCTKDHKFFTTNRGWVAAEDLTDEDDLVELQFM